MVAILFILTVIIFLSIDYIMKRRAKTQQIPDITPETQPIQKPVSIVSGPYYHPTHSWAKITDEVVTVGTNEFGSKLIGKINQLDVPKPGSYLQQGQVAWKLSRGKRILPQCSPVEGEVVEINEELFTNPSRINQSPYEAGWIMKIKPTSLRQNLKNLLHGENAKRWLENIRARFVMQFASEVGPVCQDGGELIDNAGDLLTDKEWNEVLKDYFMSEI